MKNKLFFLFLFLQQAAWGQINTQQISLTDGMTDSAILFNKYDNQIVVSGWKEDMQVSFARCTVQQVNGDTFNVKANFTGTDVLVVKRGGQVLYQKKYKVLSYTTASVNISMLPGTEATAAEILGSLNPVHKSAGNNQARMTLIPKKGDAHVFEVVGKGKDNPDIKTVCSHMQKGDKVIIEFPKYPSAAKALTLK